MKTSLSAETVPDDLVCSAFPDLPDSVQLLLVSLSVLVLTSASVLLSVLVLPLV